MQSTSFSTKLVLKSLGTALFGSMLGSTALAIAAKDTLAIQISSDIPTIDPGTAYDPAAGSIVENLYETLVGYDGANLHEIRPVLATKWKISPDSRTYTFDLRKNVKFHSGSVLSCQDAKYTLQRNLVTNSGESGNWFLAESLLGSSKNAKEDSSITWKRIDQAVRCNQQGQLVLTLPKIDPSFLVKLAYMGQSIIDRQWAIKIGEWSGTEKDWKSWVGRDLLKSQLNSQPSGTGAYKMVSRSADNFLAQAFEGYWGKSPALKKVIIQKVPEASTRQMAFMKGDADIIDGTERATDESMFKGKTGVNWLEDLPSLGVPVIFMNQEIKDPKILGSGKFDGQGIPANFFSDQDVRKGFSYAFNYPLYIKDVQKGKAKQRTMLLPENFLGYSNDIPNYTYDLEKAKTHLKKAWNGKLWEKGFKLVVHYTADNATPQIIMEILKKELEALNPKFRVETIALPWSEILSNSKKGRLAMNYGGWLPDYADPDNFMYTYYNSNGYYFPRSGWKNSEADKLTEQARKTTDQKKRAELYKKVGFIAQKEAPYIIIPVGYNYVFYRDSLKGASKKSYNPVVNFGLGTFWKNLSKQ